MRKKYFQRAFEYEQSDLDWLCNELSLDAQSQFLLKKFKVTRDNFGEFFPTETRLSDPFLLDDMDKAVAKVSESLGKEILIFGDYDADGVSAAALLYNFFNDNGIGVDVFLPSRSDGYGLKSESLGRLFEKKFYDLVITVDCGITGVAEVRYIKDVLGADVIVTDHHEICGALPDCICINPKRGNLHKELSGSAVALKLVQALSDGETAKRYCDLAALGVIGDIVPLTGENRTIVNLGLGDINNVGLRAILDAHGIETPDCAAISLKICPKLNAAGRVGDPMTAFNLLTCCDKREAERLASKLSSLNEVRKKLTDEAFETALRQISHTDKAVFVYDENWLPGVLGIVSNRLVETFHVPAGAFTSESGNIVGSMRTVDGHDLLAAVNSVAEHTLRFGGHKASVGVTVAPEKFDVFKNAFLEKLSGDKSSDTAQYFDEEYCDFYLSDKFYNQLRMFEPVLPNDAVVLRGEFTAKNAALFGKEKKHLKVLTDCGAEIVGFFNFQKHFPALAAGCRFECLVSPIKDDYTQKTVLLLSDLSVLPSLRLENLYLENYLGKCVKEQASGLAGTCFVFDSYAEFEQSEIDGSDYYLDFFHPYRPGENTVLISPAPDCDLSAFKRVVYCGGEQTPEFLYSQQIDREICAKVYRALSGSKGHYLDLSEAYSKLALFELTYQQFLVVVKIFEELGIAEVTALPFSIRVNADKKAELTDSALYNLVAKL